MWQHSGKKRPDFAVKPQNGQESVWDYPRPPAVRPDFRSVQVRWAEHLLASTQRSIRLCETASPPTFYLPPDDVDTDRLVPAPGTSVCEWKGEARYWALADDPNEAVAWSYPDPRPRYRALKDRLAFYPGRVDCFVDDEPVRPQSGRFYGGWITSDVVGPFKGEPGTGHW